MAAGHKQWLDNWRDEKNAAFLYARLAGQEKNPAVATLMQRLADVENRHAQVWAEKLTAAGVPPPPFKPDCRHRLLAWLGRTRGTATVYSAIHASECAAGNGYAGQPWPEAAAMAPDENTHARTFRQLVDSQAGQPGRETLHRSPGGNALRAGIMGANDGLVSNFSLVMGIAGAAEAGAGGPHAVLTTGIAGLLAGAISMALGEWLSVQGSREFFTRQISLEKQELQTDPGEEIEELALIYEAKGMPRPEALALASRLAERPDSWLDTLAREELGVNPDELGGSAWEAAAVSFLLFAGGALLPVLPFLFLPQGPLAIGVSTVLSLSGLFALGAAITLMTGRSLLFSGTRQVLFGLAAAAVTYGIGSLIGASL